MSFILVDGILEYEKGKSIVAVKNASALRDFFVDHVCHGMILPATLVAESVAQAAGWLVTASLDFKKRGLLIDLKLLDFGGVVRPGDQMILEAELVSLSEETAVLTGRARVGERLVGKVDSGLCLLVDAGALDDVENTRSMFTALMNKERSKVF
jgi:3-hydroxyacyl-[acyl-carrier-protein] dehydratase